MAEALKPELVRQTQEDSWICAVGDSENNISCNRKNSQENENDSKISHRIHFLLKLTPRKTVFWLHNLVGNNSTSRL